MEGDANDEISGAKLAIIGREYDELKYYSGISDRGSTKSWQTGSKFGEAV